MIYNKAHCLIGLGKAPTLFLEGPQWYTGKTTTITNLVKVMIGYNCHQFISHLVSQLLAPEQ